MKSSFSPLRKRSKWSSRAIHTPMRSLWDSAKICRRIKIISQVFQDMIFMRHQIYATVDPEIELRLPGGSDEELVKNFGEALEDEQQSNPYTYEVALGFSKNLSQPEALSKLARNESALDRSLYRALHQFRFVTIHIETWPRSGAWKRNWWNALSAVFGDCGVAVE